MLIGKLGDVARSIVRGFTNGNKSTALRLLSTKQKPLYQLASGSLSSACPLSAAIEPTTAAAVEWQSARPFEEIPKIGTLKFVSKFFPGGKYFKMDFNQLVGAMLKDYGPIFMIPAMMGRPSVLVTHNPDDFQNIFRNEGIWPLRPLVETMRYYRNTLRADFFEGVDGAVVSQGEQWASFRATVNPILLQRNYINMYLNEMAQVNQELVESIRLMRNPETLEMPNNFEETIKRWMLESVSLVALDKQLGLLRNDCENDADALKLFSALNDFLELCFQLEFKPTVWRLIATPKFKRLMQAMDDIRNVTIRHVSEAIRRLKIEQQQGIKRPEQKSTVLEMMLKRDRKVATVMSMDIMMSGFDTTASMSIGTLLCLAKNPEKQERLRAQIRNVLPQKSDELTVDALNNLPYLRACIKESLRVFPVTITNMRVPQNDLVLSGYQVPKGTWTNMISSTFQTNEKYYPRPLEYLPERWLRSGVEGNEPEKARSECAESLKPSNPFVYLPFGYGPRICIGRRISELVVELGVARLVRNFNIEFNYPTDKVFKGALVNIPNVPLKFKFTDID